MIRILGSILLALLVFQPSNAHAQSSWERCEDGKTVVHCETYDCPAGDTNGDGACSTADSGARLTDVRNDSLCANPVSGCGEVRYFPANAARACLVRIEKTTTTCNLVSTNSPNVTPRPTTSASPTVTPRATTTPRPTPVAGAAVSPTPTTTKGGESLPATGAAEIWYGIGLIGLGALGVYLYEKFRFV